MAERPKILVICDYFLPGFESGGAMRTLVNMIDRFSGRFDFRVVTRNHDGPHNLKPYESINIGEWNDLGNCQAYYLSRLDVRSSTIRKLIDEVKPDAVYLNSVFSPLTIRTLFLRRLGNFDVPVILAPEGELCVGALTLNPMRKAIFLAGARTIGLYRGLIWKAAADTEKDDVLRVLGDNGQMFVAPNMPPRTIFDQYAVGDKPRKNEGRARFVFLSRFMRKKNLNWVLSHLKSMKGDLTIDIYGPIEEQDYWEETQKIVALLPSNIKVEAKGLVSPEKVAGTLFTYDFFILPTIGENFGHVCIESLAAGCPLVISDQTPWRGLEADGIGWDLSLDSLEAWTNVIQRCIDMGPDEYSTMSQTARGYAEQWLGDPSVESTNLAVLEAAVAD
ncbi:MAG: glycosyltransferase [Chloracidobacterium sp.]|nr:glycosyltransferase [Chloracidobacterium sp.]